MKTESSIPLQSLSRWEIRKSCHLKEVNLRNDNKMSVSRCRPSPLMWPESMKISMDWSRLLSISQRMRRRFIDWWMYGITILITSWSFIQNAIVRGFPYPHYYHGEEVAEVPGREGCLVLEDFSGQVASLDYIPGFTLPQVLFVVNGWSKGWGND